MSKRSERIRKREQRELARQKALDICPYCGWSKGRHGGSCPAPAKEEK